MRWLTVTCADGVNRRLGPAHRLIVQERPAGDPEAPHPAWAVSARTTTESFDIAVYPSEALAQQCVARLEARRLTPRPSAAR